MTAAQQEYEQALACYGALGLHYLLPEPQAGLARLWLAQGNVTESLTYIAPILSMINERPLEGLEEPLRVYYTCYQVLAAVGDAQALPLLKKAHDQLQARAGRIEDEAWRTAFLTQVTAHRALVAAYTESSQASA